jgi:outer membrane protein TolC
MQQDLLRLQTERIRIQERRYEMAQRAVDAGRRFAAATGRDPGELPAPPGGLALRFPRLERSDLRDSLIAGSPLLAAMRGEVDARSAEARMKRQQWWPDLTINAGYGLRQDAPAGMARDDFLTVGLGLRLPLLSGGRQGHRVQRAELLERSAREELAADRLDLLQRLESLIDEDARHARQRELYTGGIVPLAEAALSSAIGAYSAGELDVDAVLNAQTTLLDARLTSLRHLAERAEVRASLAALLGRFGDQPAAAAKENTPDTGEQR